jgi:hypothetical protein
VTRQVAEGVTSAQVSAVIIRANGTREDLGVISYWHKNPFRRLLWRLKNRKG